MTDAELREILDDDSKTIQENIAWTQSKSISHAVEFRVKVENEIGFALWVKGSHNRELAKTSFILFSQDVGRLLAVDAGADHHNRSCENVGELHLHQWNETTKDREATAVSITADLSSEAVDSLALWRWFCRRARIRHEGTITNPLEPKQISLFDK